MKNVSKEPWDCMIRLRQRAVVTALAVVIAFVAGCGGGLTGKPMANETSTSTLLRKLPNFKPLDIESCSYVSKKTLSRSLVPSPSDTRLEIRGSAVLSRAGYRALKADYAWTALLRDCVPRRLSAIVSSGEVLVSERLNDTFSNNPTYAYGFVVILDDGNWRQIYFLATDMDHPIK